MGFILPFIVGTVFGGVVTWQIDRRRQKDGSEEPKKWWFSSKNKNGEPESQTETMDSADAADTASSSASETSDTRSDISS